jgi:hypothetical protein
MGEVQMFLILLAVASVWLLIGIFVFAFVMIAGWLHSRRQSSEIMGLIPSQAPAEFGAPRATAASSLRETEHSLI